MRVKSFPTSTHKYLFISIFRNIVFKGTIFNDFRILGGNIALQPIKTFVFPKFLLKCLPLLNSDQLEGKKLLWVTFNFFSFLHPVYPLKSKMKILIFGPIFTRFLAFCPESRALYDGINKKLGAITKKNFFLKINFSSCFSSIFPHRSVATLPLINKSAIFGFCVPKAFKWVPTIL